MSLLHILRYIKKKEALDSVKKRFAAKSRIFNDNTEETSCDNEDELQNRQHII